MRVILVFVSLLCYITAFSQQVSLKVAKDTVKIVNAELVIENGSKQKNGFLYNESNGVTSFRNLGKIFQFKVGMPNFPAAGATTYTDSGLINRHVKVWRNGLMQYRDYANGISFDAASGTITFYPALAADERIYIEAVAGFDTDDPVVLPGTSNLSKMNAGVFDNGNNTFVLRWTTNHTSLYHYPRMVGIGSSTLAGYGLEYPYRFGDRISAWLTASTIAPVWANYAVSGFRTTDVMPLTMGGISGHNIETALAANPDFIFVCLPTNDAGSDMTPAQTMTNLRFLDNMAQKAGVPMLIETSQPRTSYGGYQQTMLKQLADSIRKEWPDRYVEGFKPIHDSTNALPAVILPQYDNGDGAHLKPPGIQLIATNLFKRMEAYFQPITGVNRYVVDSSYDGTNWAQFDVISNANQVKKTYTKPRNGLIYFRVRAELVSNSTITSTIASLVPPSTGGNNFDHRVLIDLGGNGTTTLNGSSAVDGKPAPSPDQWGKYWNNWYGTGGAVGFTDGANITDLVTTANLSTPIKVKLMGSPNGSTDVPTKAMNFNGFNENVGDYPKEAVYDNMFISNAVRPAGVRLRITGLSSTNQYRIRLWGARKDDGTTPRMLESWITNEMDTDAKRSETKYLNNQAADYNNAIIHNVTGMDSVDVFLRPSNVSSFAHVSVVDIGIMGELPEVPELIMPDVSVTMPDTFVAMTPTIIDHGINILGYQWSQVSGPSEAGFTNAIGANTTINKLSNGFYVFKLRVNYEGDRSLSREVKVHVYPNNNNLKTLRVHFSRTEAAYVPGWMNMFGMPGRPGEPVIAKQDPVTGWIVDNVQSGAENYWVEFAGTSSSNVDGATTGNNSGFVPDIVLKGYWLNYTIYSANKHNMKVGGLNPAKRYTITMLGSRSDLTTTGPRVGYYRVNGNDLKIVNAYGNVNNKATWTDIAPDSNGRIYLDIFAPAGADISTNGSIGYINALIVQEQ